MKFDLIYLLKCPSQGSNFLSEHISGAHCPNDHIYTKFDQNLTKTVGGVVFLMKSERGTTTTTTTTTTTDEMG